MLQICPDNIAFIVNYALFLKKIVNNEQEAIVMFDKAKNNF
jgi:hypothetical protein